VGVVCATFLSFSVALLVAMTVFWAAESARFLLKAVENFETQDIQGRTLWFNVGIANVGNVVGRVFSTYADLRPTTRLVEGQILAWGSLINGVFVLALWTLVLFGAGVLIYRRRELATYSGH
jgi:ABC-type transport system involved in multi-copper enzyme maturation permease subunit